MQQIYRKTPMPKCHFIEITLRHGCFPAYLLYNFRIHLPKNTSGRLFLFVDSFAWKNHLKPTRYKYKIFLHRNKEKNHMMSVHAMGKWISQGCVSRDNSSIIISSSHYQQMCFMRLSFERYFSLQNHLWENILVINFIFVPYASDTISLLVYYTELAHSSWYEASHGMYLHYHALLRSHAMLSRNERSTVKKCCFFSLEYLGNNCKNQQYDWFTLSDIEHKLKVHKAIKRHLLKVFCTLNLCSVSRR